MKKLFIILCVILTCAVLLVGCGKKEQKSIDDLPENAAPVTTDAAFTKDGVPVFEPVVYPKKITGANYETITSESIDNSDDYAEDEMVYEEPEFELQIYNFVVRARAVHNYTDNYCKISDSSNSEKTEYRLIMMETVEVLHGEEMPKYFMYMLKSELFLDLSVYDSLLISIRQVGAENFVLENSTQSQFEAYDALFFVSSGNPSRGNVVAFKAGIVDGTLWYNSKWIDGYRCKDGDGVVAHVDDKEADVIARAKEEIAKLATNGNKYYTVPKIRTTALDSAEVLAALEYVKPFENGVFVQMFGYEIRYVRYINGCPTDEVVKIELSSGKVTYSGSKFTQEEIKKFEDGEAPLDLIAQLAARKNDYLNNGIPEPPDYSHDEYKDFKALTLSAGYFKAGGKAYGLISIKWQYGDFAGCMDDRQFYYSYILYDAEEMYSVIITREELDSLMGIS